MGESFTSFKVTDQGAAELPGSQRIKVVIEVPRGLSTNPRRVAGQHAARWSRENDMGGVTLVISEVKEDDRGKVGTFVYIVSPWED